jgi:hypothetical protein
MENSEDHSPPKTEQTELCYTWGIPTDLAPEYTRQGPGGCCCETPIILRGDL